MSSGFHGNQVSRQIHFHLMQQPYLEDLPPSVPGVRWFLSTAHVRPSTFASSAFDFTDSMPFCNAKVDDSSY